MPAFAPDMRTSALQVRPRQYRHPPVHEVVLSVEPASAADVAALETLPSLLRESFPVAERQERFEISTSFSDVGQPAVNQLRRPDGWRLRNEVTTRVLVATASQLSFHVVRPGPWPQGEYPGWDTIFEEALEVFRVTSSFYASGRLRRVGLRYLSRIAVPVDTEYEDWFKIGLSAPPFLQNVTSMNLRQTWARIEGCDGPSVTLGLAIIHIPDPTLRRSNVGFLLDIDVFAAGNPAPAFEGLPEWYKRAHDIEGAIFESCITENLRQRFGIIE